MTKQFAAELSGAEKSSNLGGQPNRKSRPPQRLHIRPAPSGDDHDRDHDRDDGHDRDHGGRDVCDVPLRV